MSRIARRGNAICQMNANHALEGIYPYKTDIALQEKYIAGAASI